MGVHRMNDERIMGIHTNKCVYKRERERERERGGGGGGGGSLNLAWQEDYQMQENLV